MAKSIEVAGTTKFGLKMYQDGLVDLIKSYQNFCKHIIKREEFLAEKELNIVEKFKFCYNKGFINLDEIEIVSILKNKQGYYLMGFIYQELK